MPTSPVIGVTLDHDRAGTRYELSYAYVRRLVEAGAVPVLLPFHRGLDPGAVLARVDALVLTGGNDPDPAAWGEAWHPSCVPVDPDREAFERELLRLADDRNFPVLGICFGMQLMNLVRGGSLVQFLPDVPGLLEHRRVGDDWSRTHGVVVDTGSRLAGVLNTSALEVNSSHRQAVGRVGRGLVASARAADGVVEAVEDPGKPFWIGLQWHAERMPDPRPFGSLVAAARGR